MNDDLITTLHDIAATGFNDPAPKPMDLPKPGPNRWADMTDKDFGDYYDYELIPLPDDRIVIYPVCVAALEWCYRHLPEDCPRWGVNNEVKKGPSAGFIIEARYIDRITDHMRRDFLFSDDDAAREENERQRQWE